MIKLIIFDLDGVLVETKEIHRKALNIAIRKKAGLKFIISDEEHHNYYDGRPTKEKLKLLNKFKKLPIKYNVQINKIKKIETEKLLKKSIKKDKKLINILSNLKNKYKIACASNAIRSTVNTCLKALGVQKYFDFTISNEEIQKPKPHFEMFYKCMIECDVPAKETLIIEDSHIGRQSVFNAGAHLFPVSKLKDVELSLINEKLSELNKSQENYSSKIEWIQENLNIVIPMAGRGSRFQDAGYSFPKPLIEVNGKPMIQTVVENINIKGKYIFICLEEHIKKYNVKEMLNIIKPGCEVITLNQITKGAADTVLKAKKFINNSNPLIISNSDQYIEWDSNETMYFFNNDKIDGGILTFESTHPKWSYAKVNKKGFVTEVAEKKPISNNATVGIYFYKKGKDYVSCAETMIKNDIKYNNEFYVCPVYNELIKRGGKIKIKKVKEMWGLGTPEDLSRYLSLKSK